MKQFALAALSLILLGCEIPAVTQPSQSHPQVAETPKKTPLPRIAVFPFLNRSGKEHDYLASAIVTIFTSVFEQSGRGLPTRQ